MFSRALLVVLSVALLAMPVRAQLPTAVLAVTVGQDLVVRGLSLTRLAVAEMGEDYTVVGTFLGRGKKLPKKVVLHLVTSSGKNITRPADLQGAPLGNYAFFVTLPRDEGTIKVINISSR